MISLYKEKSIISILLLLTYLLLLYSHNFFFSHQYPLHEAGGACSSLMKNVANLSGGVQVFLVLSINFLSALTLNFIVSELKLFNNPGYVPALSFLMLSALLPEWHSLSIARFMVLALIILFYWFIKLYNAVKPSASIYNAGLLAGACLLAYYPVAPVLILSFIALAITRPFRGSEWLLLLMGLLTPAYFLAGYLFLNDELEKLQVLQTIIKPGKIIHPHMEIYAVVIGVGSLFVLYGFFLSNSGTYQTSILARKARSLNLAFVICFIPGLFLIKDAFPQALLLLSLPAAILLSYVFLQAPSKIISTISFWILTALTVYLHWGLGK